MGQEQDMDEFETHVCVSVGEAFESPTVALPSCTTCGPRQSLNNRHTGVAAISRVSS